MGSGKAGCRDRPPGSCAGGNVPPKSLARDVAFAKLQSRILAAVEAVQAAKLHSDMPPEQQAIMLSAGGPGTCWTAMHKSPTELAQEEGHGATAQCNAGRSPALHVCSAERQGWGHVRAISG